MRVWFALLIAASVGACTAPPRQWEKAGTDRETAKKELGDCRRGAKSEAFRAKTDAGNGTRYLSPGSGYYYYGGRPDVLYNRRGESDFSYNESRLTAFCMRNKGFEFNYAPTEIGPSTSPPATSPPPSPPRST